LFKTITEVSREYGFSPELAVRKFIDDVINDYKYVGGFESRIKELKEEAEHIQLDITMWRSVSSNLEGSVDATGKLLSQGLYVTEIEQHAKNPETGTIDNELDQDQASGPPKPDIQENNVDLALGSDSFEKLKESQHKLPFIAETDHEFVLASNRLKTGLVTQVLCIAYFEEIKAQIQDQILWSYFCACMIYDQFQASRNVVEKQKELVPLVASIKGEAVPLEDLKRSVIIAIQTLKQALEKSENITDIKSDIAAVLHNAVIALQQLV
jgi:hypothetical protein